MMIKKLFLNSLLTLMLFASAFLVSAPSGYAQADEGWSEPVNLSISGSSSNPSILIDAEGTIHVIWFDKLDGYKYTESIDGIAWSSPKTVNLPFSREGDTEPTFVVGNNEVHILWQDEVSQALNYSRASFSNLDVPSSWTNSTELADAVVGFDVKISSRGNLYVSYISKRATATTPPGVNIRRLDGAGWSQPKNIYASQYFRSLTSEESNIRLGVLSDNTTDNVFVAWDDRPQKKIFLIESLNNANDWEPITQISSSEDYIGLAFPFNIDMGFRDNQPIVVWWAGTPGESCSLYSQVYKNVLDQSGVQDKVRSKFSFCPITADFVIQTGDFPVLSLSSQDEISFIAWDGANWGLEQNQGELPVFENPVTLDVVLLGCKKIAYHGEKIYSVGCDTGLGGDIWFRSRELGSRDAWFPPPSAWKVPIQIANVKQRISMLAVVDDEKNNVHSFWIQSSFSDGAGDATLNYSKWDGNDWSSPMPTLSGLAGNPIQFSVNADIPERLLLVWVDGETGEIFFSWANSERAASTSEWDTPVNIPLASPVNSSPNILADVSGRIVIAYAVPVNEMRGIYFVSSDDFGETWSGPSLIFDASAAGWDMVDKPELSLSGDGRLHVLFDKFSLQGDQHKPMGLYYSQSIDGGNTWSNAEPVSERSIVWGDIVGYGEQTIHRVWQEKDGESLINFHQFSQNAGTNWSQPNPITGISASIGIPSINVDQTGNLHLVQLVRGDGVLIFHQEWDGAHWSQQESYELKVDIPDASSLITSSITTKGELFAISLLDYDDPINGEINELLSTERSLNPQPAISSPQHPLIATPGASDTTISNSDEVSIPTQVSPLANLYEPSASTSRNRNLVGFLFLIGVLILSVVLLRPRFGNK